MKHLHFLPFLFFSSLFSTQCWPSTEKRKALFVSVHMFHCIWELLRVLLRVKTQRFSTQLEDLKIARGSLAHKWYAAIRSHSTFLCPHFLISLECWQKLLWCKEGALKSILPYHKTQSKQIRARKKTTKRVLHISSDIKVTACHLLYTDTCEDNDKEQKNKSSYNTSNDYLFPVSHQPTKV